MTFVTKTNLHSRSDLFIHRLPIRSIVEAIEFDGDAGDAGDAIGRRVPATLHVARHSGASRQNLCGHARRRSLGSIHADRPHSMAISNPDRVHFLRLIVSLSSGHGQFFSDR